MYCPRCGSKISDRSVICPICGEDTPHESGKMPIVIALVALAAAGAMFLILFLFPQNKQVGPPNMTTEVVTTTPAPESEEEEGDDQQTIAAAGFVTPTPRPSAPVKVLGKQLNVKSKPQHLVITPADPKEVYGGVYSLLFTYDTLELSGNGNDALRETLSRLNTSSGVEASRAMSAVQQEVDERIEAYDEVRLDLEEVQSILQEYDDGTLGLRTAEEGEESEEAPRTYGNEEIDALVEEEETLQREYEEKDAQLKSMYASGYDRHIDIVRADSEVLSLFVTTQDGYDNHMTSSISTHNYDTVTGKELSLKDILVNEDGSLHEVEGFEGDSVPKTLEEAILTEFDMTHTDFEIGEDVLRSALDAGTLHYALGYDGMHVWVSGIAQQEDGSFTDTREVVLLYDTYRDLVRSQYAARPKSYAYTMIPGKEYKESLSEGEDAVPIAVHMDTQDDIITKVFIQVDGKEIEAKTSNEHMDHAMVPHLMKMADGTCYMQLCFTGDHADIHMETYRIDHRAVTFVEENEEVPFMRYLFDPSHVLMKHGPMDMLGTIEGVRYARVDVDGKMQYETEWYDVSRAVQTLVAREDVEVDVVSGEENAPVSGRAVIEEGTLYNFHRVKGSQVEMALSDGRYCRLSVDEGSWPQTISGWEAEEVFDGIVYGG